MTADPISSEQGMALSLRTSEPLIWLGGAGREVRPDHSYHFDCRSRSEAPHVVLQLTLDGEGFYADATGRTTLPAGKAWLGIVPGPFQYGYSASPRPYELVFVSFRGRAGFDWTQRILQRFGPVLDLGVRGPIATRMLSIANRPTTQIPPDRYQVSARLYELLMTLLSELNRSRVHTVPWLADALRLIDTHAADRDFSIAALSRAVGVSREYLTRQFRSAMGVSPSDYLAQQRLRLAVRAMRSGTDKLETIARQSGFSGANYFCRLFRKRMGLTPAEYRQRPGMAEP